MLSTRRPIALILVAAMLMAAFSLCVPLLKLAHNPFANYDKLRAESITATGTTALNGGNTAEGGYIVRFKSQVPLQQVYDCVENYTFRLLANSSERIFELAIDDLDSFKKRYEGIVEDIEAERTLTLSAMVDDPLAADQWELEYMQAYEAWDISTGEREVTVAVLDSGVYRQHPDFEGVSILAGYDAVDRVNVVNVDYNGHGTKVISILAAATNNGNGMAGLGRSISVMPIRVSDSTGYIHSADFIEAVYYAADAGVDIINMSFGGYTYSAMEEAATEYASSKGCLLISAAGNKENDAQYAGLKTYPSSYSTVISVGAIDRGGVLCPFSQRNDSVDLVAPGIDVTVANMDGGYEKELGTSFSAAYVSAVAALALSAIDDGVRFTADQFISLIALLNGGKRDDGYGYGAVNALDVLSNINTPLVSGVVGGGVYHNNVTVTFNRGTAVMDGEPFYSGETVITSGSHTLTVTDGERELTLSFITDNIPLKYDYKLNSDSAVITFNRGTATLDGAPYISGTRITAEGRHFFRLTGPYGNTESYEFVCNFKAPAVFGVENGGYYTTPVTVTAQKGGTLTLNGKVIPPDTVVSASGSYSLVSSTADGKAKTTVRFTVALGGVSQQTAAVSGSKLIADDINRTLILYNSTLSGVRVFAWGDLAKTKCFIRTEGGVTGYGLTDDKLVLIHGVGITVCERATIARGDTDGVISYGFGKSVSAAVFKDGFVYYVTNEGTASALHRIDINGKSAFIAGIGAGVDFLCADGDRLVAATKEGKLFVFDSNGALIKNTATNTAISSLAADDGYICTNTFVYTAEKLEKAFTLRNGEAVLFAKNGVLVTDRAVYSLEARTHIASFGDRFIDIAVTDSGYVFKSLNSTKIEVINNTKTELNAENAAKLLNAAPCFDAMFGAAVEVSDYELNAAIPEGAAITGAALMENSGVIVAISADKRMLYRIDCATLAVVGQTHLRYQPVSVTASGNSCYVSFKDENTVFVFSAAKNSGQYYKCGNSYKQLLYADGKLFALTEDGGLYALSAENPASRAETVIRSQNVISYTYADGFLYVHLKPVGTSMLYKIDTVNYSIASSAVITASNTAVYAAGGMVFVDTKAYLAETLQQAYSLHAPVRYAYGNYYITDTGLYLAASGDLVSECRVDTSIPMFTKGYSYYSIEADHITYIRNVRADLHSLPTVGSISNSAVLDGPVSISYSFGTGYIDGELYTLGDAVENGGLHSFTVSLPFGLSHTVQFTINADINYITLSAQKTSIRVNESTLLTVNARPLTYGVVDVVYSTDNANVVVLPDGSVIGAAIGECTVTATTVDGEHSATVKIRVTTGFIEFDSSYFVADSAERLVKGIAAGTSVEAFLIAASQTLGNISVRGYNGVEVSAGMIHTGMTAELYDIYNNVIDTWHLSVSGDIDGDGFITANDYYALEKAISRAESLSPTVNAAADIDSNGRTNAFDLLALKEHLLGQRLIGDEDIAPERASNTVAHIITPTALMPGTSFTASVTLSDMKNVSAVSGVFRYNSKLLSLKSISVIGKDGGFYTATDDGIYFFTDTSAVAETSVILLAVFGVSEYADNEGDFGIACEELRVYDGSAATAASATAMPYLSGTVAPEVLIHSLPGFIFEKEQKETTLVFPAYAQNIYASAYPMEMGDIAGDTAFGNRLSAAFAVVFTDSDGVITQYNYNCERSEASTGADGTNTVYKNSNTFLAGINVEGGVLSPSFDKNVTVYYVVAQSPSTVKVSAVAESVLSVATVEPYDRETSTVSISCTAEDGSIANYTLHIRSKLPIEYPANDDDSSFIWLWVLTAAALIGGGAVWWFYRKRKPKEVAKP